MLETAQPNQTQAASSVRSEIWPDSPPGTTITREMEEENKHKVCGEMRSIP